MGVSHDRIVSASRDDLQVASAALDLLAMHQAASPCGGDWHGYNMMLSSACVDAVTSGQWEAMVVLPDKVSLRCSLRSALSVSPSEICVMVDPFCAEPRLDVLVSVARWMGLHPRWHAVTHSFVIPYVSPAPAPSKPLGTRQQRFPKSAPGALAACHARCKSKTRVSVVDL